MSIGMKLSHFHKHLHEFKLTAINHNAFGLGNSNTQATSTQHKIIVEILPALMSRKL